METLKFELTAQQADLVVKGLAKLPYEISVSTIAVMQEQYLKQKPEEKTTDP